MPVPDTMNALVLAVPTRKVSVQSVPIPTPQQGEVLVRVRAIALNPIDSLYVGAPIAQQERRIVGTDFAGVVAAVGPGLGAADDPRAKVGARVAGFVQGACSANERPGAFAEYVAIPHDLVWLVPDGLDLEGAAAVSMCGMTAAQGVFDRQGLPGPFASGKLDVAGDGPLYYLIYGASTSLAMYAVQLVHAVAAAAGRKIVLIGTASARKHALLKAAPYSYDLLFDYSDPAWPVKVREATGGRGIDFAFDGISEGETVEKIHSTLRLPEPGEPRDEAHSRLVVFRNPAAGWKPADGSATYTVQPKYGAVWEALGEDVYYDRSNLHAANARARAFAAAFYAYLSASTGEPRLHPNPLRRMPGGLERVVPDGFELLGYDQVSARPAAGRSEEHMRPISGEKMVYSLADEAAE